MSTILDKDKYKNCSMCGDNKRLTDYYKSYSPMDKIDERLRVCKKCLKDNTDINDIDSVKNTLRQVDKPYNVHLWESALTKPDVIGEYFKLINAKDYRHDTWEQSIFEKEDDSLVIDNNLNNPIETKNTSVKSKFILTDEIMDKWGYGYTEEEYQNFEKKYDKLIRNYGEKTALHTEGLLIYIRFRVKEEMATAKGDVKEAKEWGQLAQKQALDAKINVSQLSKSDISGGVDVLSQLFEAVETEVGVIPLLPKITEQPYDDVDLIIWSIINYYRRLEDKPKVAYKDIYEFYDDMLSEHFATHGYTDNEIEEFKAKRNNVFRDLENVYKEPLYEGDE